LWLRKYGKRLTQENNRDWILGVHRRGYRITIPRPRLDLGVARMTKEYVPFQAQLEGVAAMGSAASHLVLQSLVAQAANVVEKLMTDNEQLRGNLSLAEDGLAAAMQELRDGGTLLVKYREEIERLRGCWSEALGNYTDMTTQRDHWLEIAREKDRELELLEIERAAAIERMRTALVVAQRYLHEREFPAGHYVRSTVDVALREGGTAEPSEPDFSDPAGFERLAKAIGEPPHTTEDDFQHFLTYSGKRGQNEADLRLAYYAGADVGPPDEAIQRQFAQLIHPMEPETSEKSSEHHCPTCACPDMKRAGFTE
jgi:hypothetical protein